MDKCNDPDMEKLLHAYEIGMLSPEDEERFEMHLMECSYCFEKAGEFQQASQLYRSDPESRKIVGSVVGERNGKNSIPNRILRWFKPESTRLFPVRLLLIPLLLLLIAVPVFFGLFNEKTEIQYRELYLLPTLSAGDNTLEKVEDGFAKLSFVVEDFDPSIRYIISIASRTETIYSDSSFTDFNERGLGNVVVPFDKFNPGIYTLKMFNAAIEPPVLLRSYYFRVQ